MLFLKPFQGTVSPCPPLWLMRQAGRSLPEYREIRKTFSSFMEFIFTPEAAAEVTLQPIRRFDFDAAVIFSDILVIPHALGQAVTFVEEKGPLLAPLDLEATAYGLCLEGIVDRLAPIFEAITLVRRELAPTKALLGFAGSPWTVAAYMLEGETTRDFLRAKAFALSQPQKFQKLLEIVTQATILYLKAQVKAGAQVLQLFESWAGAVPASQYKMWIEAPTAQIVSALRESFPEVPLIGFPKGLGALLPEYIKGTAVQGISLDSGYPLEKAQSLPCVVQGNLDPVSLLVGGDSLEKGVRVICEAFKEKPFIFNLGHGVLQGTPLEHIQKLVDLVRKG